MSAFAFQEAIRLSDRAGKRGSDEGGPKEQLSCWLGGARRHEKKVRLCTTGLLFLLKSDVRTKD